MIVCVVLCAKMVAKFFLIKFICVLLPKRKIHILIFFILYSGIPETSCDF